MLEVKNVKAGYGNIEVLHGVSIGVKKGIACIIGPNGSGKSTLLKTIIGLLKPKSGSITFNGEEIIGFRPHEVLKKGISLIPQGRVTFPRMTVLENLEMGAYTLSKSVPIEKRLEEVYKIFPMLHKRKKQIAGTLSGGEQTMLSIGRALMLRPKMLLLDEPSLGLSPKLLTITFQKIEAVRDSGTPVVLVEQNVRKVLSVSNYVFVLDQGKVVFEGVPEKLLGDQMLIRLYLGKK